MSQEGISGQFSSLRFFILNHFVAWYKTKEHSTPLRARPNLLSSATLPILLWLWGRDSFCGFSHFVIWFLQLFDAFLMRRTWGKGLGSVSVASHLISFILSLWVTLLRNVFTACRTTRFRWISNWMDSQLLPQTSWTERERKTTLLTNLCTASFVNVVIYDCCWRNQIFGSLVNVERITVRKDGQSDLQFLSFFLSR